jgi:hypothetical protein
LKEEALDRTMWRARFGRGFGPVVRQTAKLMSLVWGYLGFGGSYNLHFAEMYAPNRIQYLIIHKPTT